MGSVITVGKDIAPESDIAVFNMLGVRVHDKSCYPGRGVVESIGCRGVVAFKDGDLASEGQLRDDRGRLHNGQEGGGGTSPKEEAADALQEAHQGGEAGRRRVRVQEHHRVPGSPGNQGGPAPLSAEIPATNTDPAYVRTRGARRRRGRSRGPRRCRPAHPLRRRPTPRRGQRSWLN